MNDPDNIIALTGAVSHDLEITRKDQERKHGCYGVHKSIIVDDIARTVTCKTCGLTVDAFDYLLAWAIKGDKRMQELNNLEIRLKISHTELADLTRQIKNMRQVLKRGGHPQSELERRQYDSQRMNAGYL